MPIVSKILKISALTLALAMCVFAQDELPELVKRIKPSSVAIETFDAKGNSLSRGSGILYRPGPASLRIVTSSNDRAASRSTCSTARSLWSRRDRRRR
jgi:hypothetical protein